MGLIKLLNPVDSLVKATPANAKGNQPERTTKSWSVDPYSFVESLTHRERPSSLSYDQLRLMSQKCDVVSAIIFTRASQVAAFSQPQPDKYSMGYTVAMRDGRKPGSRAAQAMVQQLTTEIGHCGIPGAAGDKFETFLKKFVRDTLIYDQVSVEIVPRNNGLPAFFEAVDAATIRFAAEPPEAIDQRGFKDTSLDPTPFQQAMAAYNRDLLVKTKQGEVPAKYVQVVNGVARTTYAADELWFGVRNPRTDINIQGYGLSELEVLISTVTSYLYATEYNRRIFTQGSLPTGLLNLKGEITDEQLAAFKREWNILISGAAGYWKTPVVNAEDVEYVNLRSTNNDMQFSQWVQFLLRIASAIYLIDPAEINFDMPRGLDQTNPMIESSNEGKLQQSRDRGLKPLLRFIQGFVNEAYVQRIDPDFEFKFAGLEAKTIEQEQTNITSAVTTYLTLNEVRAQEDRPPLPMGDMPLNAIYLSAIQAQQQAEEQQEQMEQQAEMEQEQMEAEHQHEKQLEQIKAKAHVEGAKHQAKATAARAKAQPKKKAS